MKRKNSKTEKRKLAKSGYKQVPGITSDPCELWLRRPCNKGKTLFDYRIKEMFLGANRHKSECEKGPVPIPELCDRYDPRYCPQIESEIDEDDFTL